MDRRRPASLKIPDIKTVRHFTQFLGKVGIEECYSKGITQVPIYDAFHHQIGTQLETKYYYGWGMKQSKDWAEARFDYYQDAIPYNPRREIEHGNQMQQIKCTRKLMSTLNKLNVQSADSGLKVCKLFTDRLRAPR